MRLAGTVLAQPAADVAGELCLAFAYGVQQGSLGGLRGERKAACLGVRRCQRVQDKRIPICGELAIQLGGP